MVEPNQQAAGTPTPSGGPAATPFFSGGYKDPNAMKLPPFFAAIFPNTEVSFRRRSSLVSHRLRWPFRDSSHALTRRDCALLLPWVSSSSATSSARYGRSLSVSFFTGGVCH
jgi:hypothetical protein